MDDGNPFNDSDETEETVFGPDYFYGKDQEITGSQKWLRNDPTGFELKKNGMPLVSRWTKTLPMTAL